LAVARWRGQGPERLEGGLAEPSASGFSPDYIQDRYDSFETAFDRQDWTPTVSGKALLQNNAPILSYIGGKAAKFTSKDHDFYPGETVEKQLILINDSRKDVICSIDWSLNLPVPMTGKTSVAVKAGDQQRLPLKITFSESINPGTYTLSAIFRCGNGETQEDSFAIQILPRALGVKSKTKIALFDPLGETTKLLNQMGIQGDKVEADSDLSRYDLLIVASRR